MKLGKHTLVIDGNYFVHSRLFVLPRKKGQVLLSDDESKAQLMRKLSIDLASDTFFKVRKVIRDKQNLTDQQKREYERSRQ